MGRAICANPLLPAACCATAGDPPAKAPAAATLQMNLRRETPRFIVYLLKNCEFDSLFAKQKLDIGELNWIWFTANAIAAQLRATSQFCRHLARSRGGRAARHPQFRRRRDRESLPPRRISWDSTGNCRGRRAP